MEEDIQNYSPTVMFRGTLCIFYYSNKFSVKKNNLLKQEYLVFVKSKMENLHERQLIRSKFNFRYIETLNIKYIERIYQM